MVTLRGVSNILSTPFISARSECMVETQEIKVIFEE